MSQEALMKLLNRGEAADYINRNRRTLENWDRQNVGPHVIRLPSGLPAYTEEDLDEFVNSHRELKARSDDAA